MKIFDAHISGSLSVSSSAQIEGDLTVLGTVNATISGTTTNALTASEAPRYTLTSSFHTFTSSYTTASSSFNTRVGNLESFSSSLDSNFVSETEFGSHTGSVNSFTSSANGRLSSIESSTGSLNTFTSSANGRLSLIETSTGALNTFTSSIDTTIKNKLNTEGVISGSIQVTISSTTGYSTFSSSIATTTSNIENRAGSLETSTSSLNTFTSSAGGRLTAIETSTSSLNTFSSSTLTRLTSLESTTSSLNSYTSSNTTNINAIHTATSSLNSYTSSANGRLSLIETSTGALNTFTSSAGGRLSAIETSTSSLNSYTSSNNTTLGTLQTATGALNTFSSSTNTRLNAIETSTSSLNTFTSSIDTTIKNKLNTEGVISGSVQVTISNTTGYSTFSSSIATTDSTQDGRLTSLEGKTGSYATTGSNIFIGNQTITGSLYITQDLVIGGSSSIQHITSSQLNIGDNIITVNAQNPSIRFGGLAVIDSGSSPQVSGSILFDSINNQWVFVHQNQGTVTSSVLLMGPETYNNLGGESYITTNRLVKSTGIEHLTDSNITDTGTKVSINSNTEVTGTFVATGTALVSGSSQISFSGLSGVPSGIVSGSSQVLAGTTIHSGAFFNGISVVSGSAQISFNGITDKPTLVSGSSQIDHNSTTNYVANQHTDHTSVSISAGNGLSGGGDISTTRTLTLDTGSAHFTGGVKTKMNTDGVVSSSAQVVAALPSGTVSGSSQVLNGTGIWSGSAQLPAGVVSGSSQVSFSGLSGVPAGLVSGSSQITYGSISGIPSGIVSGSSQISFGSISGVPSGLVSGSSQITFGSITGVPSGLVSGSSQVLNGSGVWSGSAQLPSGVVSGSSQIAFGSITGVPSGLVSGSSQVAIASTSGFGTYINQAVTTTSTPTFDYVITSNNGNGTNIRLGDDAWFGDVNLANTTRLMGVQNNANGYIIFGNGDNTALGRASTGALTYGGNTVWHAGNDGASSGLDADLLDGSHASAFSPVAGSSSITTVGTISSGTWNGSSISTTYTDAKVTSVSAGTGISVNATTGAVTVTNSGVTSIAGTSNQVVASASTGGVTLSLPQSIATTSTPTFGGLTIGTSGADSSFPFYVSTVNTTGKYTLTNPGLGFNLSDNYAQLQLYGTAGAYIDFTTTSSDYQGRIMYSSGAFTITGNMSWGGGTLSSAVWQGSSISTAYTDAKVTSVNAGTGVSVNATTGAVTVTNTGTLTVAGTANQVLVNGATAAANGNITLSLPQSLGTGSSPTFASITIGKSGTDSTITFPQQTNDPGYIKHYESNNTAIMYFNVSDDTNDEFHFGYTADASTFRLRADGVVLEGTWQGSSISTSYTDAKVTSVNAGTGISVNATTGAVTVTNSGVTSIAGTSNQITASASTGGVTLSLPQNIHTSASPTFAGLSSTDDIVITNGVNDGLRIEGTAPTITFADSDNRTAYIHVNSDWFYVLTAPANSADGSWSQVANSRWPFRVNLSNNNAEFGADVNAISFTLSGGAAISNGSGSYSSSYGYFSTWMGVANTGLYTYANIYMDLDDSSSQFQVRKTDNTYAFKVLASGNAELSGVFTENSSIRYKKDIETIPYGLEKVIKMRGVTYLKKENNQKEVGVIAEEIAEILPDVVVYDSEGNPDSVSYGRITAVLIEAIKDLKKEIEELKGNR